MKFGIFYELQLPKPWEADSEYRLFNNALDQIELADRLLADGQRVVSDPGSGIVEPGWHWFDELVEIVGEVVTETERLI